MENDRTLRDSQYQSESPHRPDSLPIGEPEFTPSPDAPVEFGRYELLKEIGRGGMGVVYKARHRRLDRTVALKMFVTSIHVSPKELVRFEQEAIAGARVLHPNVVQVYDAGRCCGQNYIAMEFVEGQDLEDVLADRAISPEEAARHLSAIARAVHHMHKQKILHRDLKPSNILLDGEGIPKVTDFGLARLLEANQRLTGTRTIMGTPNYMAPEQACADIGAMGPWSDVHALGAVLYRLLAGDLPFDGPTPMQTVLLVIKSSPPRPRAANAKVPRSLEAICMKCLEKSPARRYQSAADLADDLDRYLAGQTTEAEGSGVWASIRRWAERETRLAAHLGILLMLMAIYLGIYYLFPAHSEPFQLVLAKSMALWSLCCIFLKKLESSETLGSVASVAWGGLDAFFITGLMLIVQGMGGLGTMGYPLAIVLSGLSLDRRAVGVTSALSLLGLVVLVVDSIFINPSRWIPLDSLALAAVIVTTTGILVDRQVRRTQALSAYLDREVTDEENP